MWYSSNDRSFVIFILQISQLFGYGDEKQFINEHYGTILATLIPWSIKHDKCFGLIDEICDIIQKDMSTTLCSSFLSIYSHLYLHESAETNNKGMDFILNKTEHSLYHLLKSDTKVIFHRFNKN